jgi:hypothetical protein
MDRMTTVSDGKLVDLIWRQIFQLVQTFARDYEVAVEFHVIPFKKVRQIEKEKMTHQ